MSTGQQQRPSRPFGHLLRPNNNKIPREADVEVAAAAVAAKAATATAGKQQ